MSDHTAPAGRREGLRAVCYFRCSSSQQELSVADQRREALPYAAKKGYRVVREYVDEGKSASKNPEQRTAFNRMIADSAAGEFDVVVCYDAARFTRFDNIDGSTPKQILRANGVILDTVKEGEFDWRTPVGRWMDMAYCEANNAVAKNISRDSNRGRVNVLKLGRGYWPNGVVPYGYDREYTDGVSTLFVPRSERARKPKGWHLRLVPNDAEAATVREVFDLFVNRRWSLRQIASALTGRGVPSPVGPGGVTNRMWSHVNVGVLLREKAYTGVASIGGRRPLRPSHHRIEPAEAANACPPLVEPHVWHEAQEVIAGRRGANARPQSGRGGVLSGFLVCGHCGYRMTKRPIKGRVKFCCNSAGIRPHLGCKTWGVYEDELLPRVLGWLVEAVEQEVVDRLQAVPPAGDEAPSEEDVLARQVDTLTAKVKGATESALLAPPAAREAAWAMVNQWQTELEAARQKLELVQAVRSAPEFDGFEAWWAGVKDQIVMVETTRYYPGVGGPAKADELTVGNPSAMLCPVEKDRLRALLARLGFACKVWFEEKAEKVCRRQGFYAVKDVQISGTIDPAAKDFLDNPK